MSSPTPLPRRTRVPVKKTAGVFDRDASMKDLTATKDRSGVKKGTSGKKVGHRNRAMETIRSIIGPRPSGTTVNNTWPTTFFVLLYAIFTYILMSRWISM